MIFSILCDIFRFFFPQKDKKWQSNKPLNDTDLAERTYYFETSHGDKLWFLNGKLHRKNDLPAIECLNGNKYWYLNGLLHRENDFPAVERNNGDKEWWLNGKLHRKSGSAIETVTGHNEWLNGIRVKPKKYRLITDD